jgi:hypothetical protein
MRAPHHFLISVFTVLALSGPAIVQFSDARLWLFPIAAGFGALLPDADGGDAAVFHAKIKGTSRFVGRRLARFIDDFFGTINFVFLGFFGKYLLCLPYRFLVGAKARHRGVFHSVYAGLFSSVVVSSILSVIVISFSSPTFDPLTIAFFFVGFFSGFFLHLLEDACTASGIDFLAPFGSFFLRGNHGTDSGNQLLPDAMTYALLLLAVAPFALTLASAPAVNYVSPIPYWEAQGGLVAAVVAVWALFLFLFGVRKGGGVRS